MENNFWFEYVYGFILTCLIYKFYDIDSKNFDVLINDVNLIHLKTDTPLTNLFL